MSLTKKLFPRNASNAWASGSCGLFRKLVNISCWADWWLAGRQVVGGLAGRQVVGGLAGN